MSGQYILDGRKPVPCADLTTWGRWMQGANRHVAQDRPAEGIHVSTVFLGLDHSFSGGTPILFETLVFGGPSDGDMERYSTWEEAEEGHRKMVEKLQDSLGITPDIGGEA